MIRFLYKINHVRYLLKVCILATLCIAMCLTFAWTQDATAAQTKKIVNEIQFDDNHSVPLKGTWQYYPQQFITKPNAALKAETVILPVSFKQLSGSNQSYGTFIGHFRIPKTYIGRNVAIFIPNQYGAYRVYLNGDFILRSGEVGKNPEQHQTENIPKIACFVLKKQSFTITIQASNFNNLHGGLEKPIRIGLAKTVIRQFQQLMMAIGLLCGVVFGLGMFTLMFSVLQGKVIGRSRIRAFVFGAFIIFLALHNLFSAPYAYTVFTNISWTFGERLENLFTCLTIAFFLTYMFLLNWRYLRPSIYAIAILVLVMNVVVTLFTIPDVFQIVAAYSSLFSIVVIGNFAHGFYLTLKYNKNYSKINLWATILLCVTFLHDFLITLNLIDSFHLSFISTSVYALLIMFQQSKDYGQHAHYIEELNNNLLELNSDLDHKVQERTLELNKLNNKLERQVQIDSLTGAFNRHALNAEIQKIGRAHV